MVKQMEVIDTPVEVRVVSTKGENTMVEYGEKRVTVPSKYVIDGKVKPYILRRGIVYGIDFEEVLDIQVDTVSVVKALHARNIWTENDVMTRPNEVIGALSEALHLTLSDLLNKIKERKQHD